MDEDNHLHADRGPHSETEEPSQALNLPAISEAEPEPAIELKLMTKSQAWNLYTSHFLSTWNMRLYEFAAVGYLVALHQSELL